MSRLATTLFTAWRRIGSPVFASSGLGHCRHLPTCSEYAYIAVSRHGWLRGSALALARLARCHPWAAGGHDPVPPASDPFDAPSQATLHRPPHGNHLP